ncbi:MAG: gamma-glutamyl-gamma-aminobutyrate hydrolase family protein [Dethiobacter sp.]|jgi:putative glutamine amidotransferase|nr:MAG: gamma-glutamyl-gamma-aminobutyrate hydrolase family protein [Dethiobacter sp.]
MLPIGITCVYNENFNFTRLSFDYIRSIEKAGGIPVPVSILKEESIPGFLKIIKGLVLSGGGDVDPLYYGEEPLPGQGEISPLRDRIEIELTRAALRKNLPVLGICRGAQVLNIAAGGSIYQDISLKEGMILEHMQRAPRHHLFHDIKILEDTLLYRIFRERKTLRVNSFHHQAVKKLGDGFRVSAVASDGVVESLESEVHSFALGVQWHPEALAVKEIWGGQEIFDVFLRAVSLFK